MMPITACRRFARRYREAIKNSKRMGVKQIIRVELLALLLFAHC